MWSQKHRKTPVQEELERRILHGLACEWEKALWVLDTAHEELMLKPLFSLTDMTNKHGYWSSEKREICLSRNLVLNHPWDAILEVLLHEMAHQFAEEVLGASDEPPHGPKFQRACYLLRANPKASGKYEPLDGRIRRKSSRSEDRIMIRVKKLMALAQSQNQHEAELAMAKAHEFIAKYNLDLLAHNKDRDFVSVFVGKSALRHFREDYHLARLLQDFYFVYGLWVSTYVLEKDKMGRVLEVSGTVQNTKIACYIHAFVQHYIDSQWRKYNEAKGLNRYRKTDFAVGIIEGFRSKLKSQSEGKNPARHREPSGEKGWKVAGTRALIKLEDPLLLKYAAYRYPRTTSFKRRVSSQDDVIFRDGMKFGKKLVISKGITDKATSSILLIGDRNGKN